MQTFFYCAATFEILGRSFALGFGLRMLKYILWDDNLIGTAKATREDGSSSGRTSAVVDDDQVLRNLPARCKISAVCGLSTAAIMFGLSLFLPTKLRSKWYQYD